MKITHSLTFIATGLSLACATLGTMSADAATVKYDFQVQDLTGAYSGQVLPGSFSFDDSILTGQGNEVVTSQDDGLSFFFPFFNQTLTEKDDPFDRTTVFFKDGEPVRIYFRSNDELYPRPRPFILAFSFAGGTDANGDPIGLQDFVYQFDYDPSIGIFSESGGEGKVVFKISGNNGASTSVPEPATISGVAMLGMCLFLQKIKAK